MENVTISNVLLLVLFSSALLVQSWRMGYQAGVKAEHTRWTLLLPVNQNPEVWQHRMEVKP